MIRQATTEDIPRLVELGAQMHAESENHRHMQYSGEHAAATVQRLLDHPGGLAVVYESAGEVIGFVLAFAAPHFFSPDITTCDLALYVEPGHRGNIAAPRLLQAYEFWAKDMGAMLIQLGIMTGVRSERTEALCERLGWRRLGVVMGI